MDLISTHELKDVIRVDAGILIEVHKYEYQAGWIWIPDCKKHLKKVSGVKNGFVVKEDFKYKDMEFTKGEFILDHFKAIPLEDKSLYRIELKCAGGSVKKSFKQMEQMMNKITEYIKNNY